MDAVAGQWAEVKQAESVADVATAQPLRQRALPFVAQVEGYQLAAKGQPQSTGWILAVLVVARDRMELDPDHHCRLILPHFADYFRCLIVLVMVDRRLLGLGHRFR